MNDLQTAILKKLKTYKTPKTARQLFDAMKGKHPYLQHVQQMNSNLSALYGRGLVKKIEGKPHQWEIRPTK